MNIKLSPFFFKRLGSYFLLLSCMVLFQNCGASDDSVQSSRQAAEQEEADSLPFAFDFTIDHIAYMSCESNTLTNSNKLFNFKAGAFNEGEGLRYKSNFVEAIGDYEKDKVLSLLAASERNNGAGVVMSIRSSENLSSPLRLDGENTDPETVFDSILGPMIWDPVRDVQLTNETLAGFMFDNRNGVNYISGLKGLGGRSFESQITYNAIGAQGALRSSLNGGAFLAFNFAAPLNSEDGLAAGVRIRSPSSPSGDQSEDSVWGKGYTAMTFSQLDAGRKDSPSRVLSAIASPTDLEGDVSLDENWVCPASERYIIMKSKADALRRYDAAPATRDNGTGTQVPNEPFHFASGADPGYDDGGFATGGYYANYMQRNKDTNVDESLRHKVLCPMLPDQMSPGQTEHEDDAWKRIRDILPAEDWFVFRGKGLRGDPESNIDYNCIVPKVEVGSCYGEFELQQQEGSNSIPIIQYRADEDFPKERIDQYEDSLKPDARPLQPRIFVQNCRGDKPEDSLRFCSHVLSVCYKQ